MFNEQNVPWNKICDYIGKIGTEQELSAFCNQAVRKLEDIIPYDLANYVIFNTGLLQISEMRNYNVSERITNDYLNYYVNLDPFKIKVLQSTNPLVNTSWINSRDTEYVTDFIKPLSIHYSMAISVWLPRVGQGISLVFHRTGKIDFSVQELLTAQALQPHLTNFASFLTTFRNPRFEESCHEYHLLTQRETMILDLLQSCTVMEIATRLLISRRTVEYHIANIYDKLKVRNRRELIWKLRGYDE